MQSITISYYFNNAILHFRDRRFYIAETIQSTPLVKSQIKRSLRKAVNSSTPMILTISFLAFITTSSVVFGYFKTDAIVDIDKTYLELDYSLDVQKPRYIQMKAYAVAMLFVYPLGIPALYFVLLFRERGILKKPIEDRTTAESEQVGYLDFLAASYKPAYWCGQYNRGTGRFKCCQMRVRTRSPTQTLKAARARARAHTHTHTHKVGGGLRVLQTPAFVSGPCVRDPRVRDSSRGGTASGADQRPRMHKFHTSQDPFSPASV